VVLQPKPQPKQCLNWAQQSAHMMEPRRQHPFLPDSEPPRHQCLRCHTTTSCPGRRSHPNRQARLPPRTLAPSSSCYPLKCHLLFSPLCTQTSLLLTAPRPAAVSADGAIAASADAMSEDGLAGASASDYRSPPAVASSMIMSLRSGYGRSSSCGLR
jgi:hypothetical protein